MNVPLDNLNLVRLTPNYEVRKIFTSQQEKDLCDYLILCAKMCYSHTTRDFKMIAYEMAVLNNVAIPNSWQKINKLDLIG